MAELTHVFSKSPFINTKWIGVANTRFYEILCSHGDEYEDGCLLMMKTVNTSETSVNFYQFKRRNIPEESSSIMLLFNTKKGFIPVNCDRSYAILILK
jgi:hypothetical protein